MKLQDLTDKLFGKLTAKYSVKRGKLRLWLCLCECGNTKEYLTSQLNSGACISCGCIRQPNLIGKKFNNLSVLNRDETRNRNRTHWLCLCECGNTVAIETSKLQNGHTKSCGCIRKGKPNYKLRKPEALLNAIIAVYKHNANMRNLEFILSKEEVVTLFKSNCYYCGVEPHKSFKRGKIPEEYIYNGIDRIDNQLGYSKENSVACCTYCNYKKGDDDLKKFLKWIKDVYINLELAESLYLLP